MILFEDAESLQGRLAALRAEGRAIGFVPTMGSLHAGHGSLMQLAAMKGGAVVASIFVNPMQFNDKRDYELYPVDHKRDMAMLKSLGVDSLYLPSVEGIYPKNHQTRVFNSGLAQTLEGPSRPGHFEGVLTVVSILFNIVRPNYAVFGEKDFQQLRIIEQLVEDMKLPIEIVRAPIFREASGLAMSSRNARLSKEGHKKAAVLSRGLFLAKEEFEKGERRAEKLEEIVRREIEKESAVEIEYVSTAGERDLKLVEVVEERARIFVAGEIEGVRLIDNIAL